jgi:hypothetical protein
MQKNRLFIVLTCLNCAHTTHAVEQSGTRVEEQDPLQKSLENCLMGCLSKLSKRYPTRSTERKAVSQVIREGDVETQKKWILTHYTDMLEGAKTRQAHAPEELGQEIDDIMGEINNLNKVVNEEGIKQLGTMDERIKRIVTQTIFFHNLKKAVDGPGGRNLYKSGWEALGGDETMKRKCLFEITRTVLSKKMIKSDREHPMNAGMEIPSNQTICSTKENICRVQIPSQEEAKKRRNRLEEAKKRRNRLEEGGVDTSL